MNWKKFALTKPVVTPRYNTHQCIKIHLKKCNLLHMIGARLVVCCDPANKFPYIVSGPNLSWIR